VDRGFKMLLPGQDVPPSDHDRFVAGELGNDFDRNPGLGQPAAEGMAQLLRRNV
jgi:hypothetical protein